MTTHTQFCSVPQSREMRRRGRSANDTELHHDDSIAPVLVSVFCDTHIVVRAPLAHSLRSREQDLAALDREYASVNAKRQGEGSWSGVPQTRPTRRSDSYPGSKVLATREGAIEKDDIDAPASKAISMRATYREGTEDIAIANSGQCGRDSIMNRLVSIALALLCATSVSAADLGADMTNASVHKGVVLSTWNPVGMDIGYAFAGQVERLPNRSINPWTVLTVGAQINAVNRTGVNQIAFGIATEAGADFGSFSMLTGIEATAVNREPDNPLRKISMWSTFKNRPDGEYFSPPTDPANMNTQALRVESQLGTGFERGVVFAQISLHASRNLLRPVAIDFAEMDEAAVEGADIMRFPDGCSVVYLGHGQLGTRCDR
jgi:hypothetical protein